MRVLTLLQEIFEKAHSKIDNRLHHLVLETAETLSHDKQLSIAGLGRGLTRGATVKSNIKTVDRLFGNTTVAKNTHVYYEDCTRWLVGNNKHPIILIDWSGLSACGEFHFLRACVPMQGRALPLLDMTFREKDYGSKTTHKQFLDTLKRILPADCVPIIVTDAGFRCTWFNLVTSLGWNFIGRVRSNILFKEDDTTLWKKTKSLYSQAKTKAQFIFSGKLAKSNPVSCHFYLQKEKKKNRANKNLKGEKRQSSASKKHEKRENEPWLIVSSLEPNELSSHEVINLYKKRMQVEESFRDLKNTRNGFSLRHCGSRSVERLNVALLISAIAMLMLWILGCAAKEKNMHYSYQANSTKTRNILSVFTIGWQVLKRDLNKFKHKEMLIILYELKVAQENHL